MGYGDELMATGMARGARERGKRIAFGDGNRIIWGPHCAEVFRGNPNIAAPGTERSSDIEWIAHHKGNRAYNRHDKSGNKWVWNYEFRAVPGEMFFEPRERRFAEGFRSGFVLIEPNVPRHKSVAPNKDWGFARYQEVANRLVAAGHRVCQFVTDSRRSLQMVERIRAPSFRHALAALSRASLYIGPEGGLHHGAAAVSVPGVVLFGGFIPPEVTGYDTHTNLTGGAKACGSLKTCRHCRAAMEAIGVRDVLAAAQAHLSKRAA